jgi:hypothetical protein
MPTSCGGKAIVYWGDVENTVEGSTCGIGPDLILSTADLPSTGRGGLVLTWSIPVAFEDKT